MLVKAKHAFIFYGMRGKKIKKNTSGAGMFNKQWKNNFNAFWNSIFKEGQLLINSPFIMMPLRCLTLLNIGF